MKLIIRNYVVALGSLLIPCAAVAQDTSVFIEGAAKAMGIESLARLGSYTYSGTGTTYDFGKTAKPGEAWVKSGTWEIQRSVDFDAGGLVETRKGISDSGAVATKASGAEHIDIIRIPFRERYGEQGNQYDIWLNPVAFLKGAIKFSATMKPEKIGSKSYTAVSFIYDNNPDKVRITGYFNKDNQLERAEALINAPLFGDTPVVAEYSDYHDFQHGLTFPSKVTEKIAGYPVLEFIATGAIRNSIANVGIPVVAPVRNFDRGIGQAQYHGPFMGAPPPITVDETLYGENIYYFRFRVGDDLEVEDAHPDYHSILVEFNDYLVVIEAPLDDAHSRAAIQEIHNLFGRKPIRYVVNTHTTHLVSDGGLRAYAAEGATIITQGANTRFLTKVLAQPHTVVPDQLSKSQKKVVIESVAEKRTLTDGTHTIDLDHIVSEGSEGMLMAYFPKERIVAQADLYVVPDPDILVSENDEPVPVVKAPLTPSAPAFANTLASMKLDYDTMLNLEGRATTKAELLKDIQDSAKH